MNNIPKDYAWLYTIGQLPKLVTNFLAIYGTKEVIGAGNSPVIMGWAKKLGIKDFINDAIAWCGLAMAWIVFCSGYEVVASPLWAKNWLNFGVPVKEPMLGDVCVFDRKNAQGISIGGHVGLYIAEDATTYHIGGGNTSDDTEIARILKTRLIGARRPPFKIGQPNSVKKYFVTNSGKISVNEA